MVYVSDVSAMAGKSVIISSEFYIGETALYQCCPQLHELKNLLEGGKRLSYKSVIPKMEKSFCEQENDPKAVDVSYLISEEENIELNRIPFDFFESEPELVSGFNIEFRSEFLAEFSSHTIAL